MPSDLPSTELFSDEIVFEVTVWGHEGDILEKRWEATWDEVEAIQSQYEDHPFAVVDFKEAGY